MEAKERIDAIHIRDTSKVTTLEKTRELGLMSKNMLGDYTYSL